MPDRGTDTAEVTAVAFGSPGLQNSQVSIEVSDRGMRIEIVEASQTMTGLSGCVMGGGVRVFCDITTLY